MSHTPGPWVVWGLSSNDGEAEVVSKQDGSKTICWTADTYNEVDGEGEVTSEDLSNARLIAAAPDMMTALIEAHTAITYMMSNDDCGGASNALEQVVAAIAKAEGRADV